MTRVPTAVVIGSIGKLPYAGTALFWLHYVVGLQQLGYHVHYVERQNSPQEFYDPRTDAMTDDVTTATTLLESLGTRYGARPEQWTLIDGARRVHGSSLDDLRDSLRRAHFVLDVGDLTWFDELELCPRRILVDCDPIFTQARILDDPATAELVDRYHSLFTIGARIGAPDCTVPTCGRAWFPTRTVVATDLWEPTAPGPGSPVTALLHWSAGNPVVIDGREYGHKDRELPAFTDLPTRCEAPVRIALGGGTREVREQLVAAGWELVDPLEATRDLAAYRAFIDSSLVDLGIAKHAYVASRCGWFSDRAMCFLAAGRPVLHQDTGFGEWLGAVPGVLPFSDVDDVVRGLAELEAGYAAHAAGARAVAESAFEARTVLRDMLTAVDIA